MAWSILIVDDSIEIQKLVRSILSDYSCTSASSLNEARLFLSTQTFDLILLDVLLPDGNGFEFFAHLKSMVPKDKSVPSVIILTSRSDTSEKVMGLTLGADDYITKPFDLLEFKARVQSKLKKHEQHIEKSSELRVGNLRIDLFSKKLSINSVKEGNSEPWVVDLTPIEFQLLSYFMKHRGHILTREQLLQNIWGNQVHVLDRTVDGQIKGLRKKIEKSNCSIRTVYGDGYVFEDSTEKKRVAHG